MKKLKNRKSRIPRKIKVILYALGLVLLVPLAYLALGCPALTPEMAFRRAERANLLGPSTILGIENDPGLFYGKPWHMIYAETDQVCMIYSCFDGKSGYSLYCAEKTGDATVLYPELCQSEVNKGTPVPSIVVFDDLPNAKSARLEVTQKGSHFFYYSTYIADRRTHPGYFLFHSDGEATLSEISDSHTDSGEDTDITVVRITVSFYNEDGTLIAERSFDY